MKRYCLVLFLVLSLFVFVGCTKEEEKVDSTKLVENKDYYVRGEHNVKYLDLTKRGYYIDTLNEPNAPYFYIICMGEKSTGGYSLEVKEVYRTDDGETVVIVDEKSPGKDDIVTQAFTYPTLMIEFPSYQEKITIKNMDGVKFEQLKDY
jgi:hypothetical protein